MSEDRWQRVKDVFWAAHELPVAEREAYARAQCAADETEVLTDVLAMLAGDAGAETSFLSSPMPAAAADVELPTLPRRLGNYELVELLGRGGMGVVYRARQDGLERDVAVKVLPAEFTLDERLVARFQREARAVGKLRHPGIVPIYDVGVVNHEHYFVMELVKGHDLYHELRRLRGDEPGGAMLPRPESHEYLTAVVQLVLKVARSLAYAHDNGVVHRDIKPRNLIVERVDGDASPRAAVLDFGLARDLSQGQHSLSHEVAGTPHYMSPEQIDAKRATVDERTDLYSLGVVLYELLTLTHPFRGKTNLEIMQQISARDPLPPRALNPRVPRDLETVCLKAVEKDPADRYADMDAFAEDLRRFLHHEAVLASRPSARARASRHLRRHRRSYAAACVGAVAILVVGVVAWSVGRVAEVERLHGVLLDEGELPVAELSVASCQRLESAARALTQLVDPESAAGIDAARWLGAFEAHVEQLASDGRALIGAELEPADNAQQIPLEEGRFQAGKRALRRAAALRPSDGGLASEATDEHYYPRVRLVLDDELRAADARGDLRVLYATYGWEGVDPPLELEGWRDGEVRLPESDYMLRVEVAGLGAAEATRWLRLRGRTYDFRPRVLPHAELVADMIHIPAGMACVGLNDDPRNDWLATHERFIGEYWIDRTEVSVRDFREFLLATGRGPLEHWVLPAAPYGHPPTFDLPEEWLDKPVFGVSWFDAQAYAEWKGKRLPLWFEWQRAASGANGWALPWAAGASSGDEVHERAVIGRRGGRSVHDAPVFNILARVDAGRGDLTPAGVMHMLGNVREWTANHYTFRFRDRPFTERVTRLAGGHSWSMPATTDDLLHQPATATYHSGYTGFRCVVGSPTPVSD